MQVGTRTRERQEHGITRLFMLKELLITFTNEEELWNVLVKFTEKFENNAASPSLVKDMDEHYVTDLMKAIVAFEIEITEMQHVLN